MVTKAERGERLERRVAELIDNAKAPNTRRAYESRWAQWVDWCMNSMDIDPMNATGDEFALYVAAMVDAQLKVSTIKQARAAVRHVYEEAGKPSPTTMTRVTSVVQGARRELGDASNRARALLPSELAAMFEACADRPATLRDRAMLLVWFHAALRRSELAALDRRDISVTEGGLSVLIRRSKTDQFGEGKTIPIARTDTELCPVKAWERWARAAGDSGPAFPPISKTGKVLARRMNPGSLAGVLDRLALDAGVDLEKLSPHSMRAGFVTDAAMRGHTPNSIARITRHTDMNVLDSYIRPVTMWDNPILKPLS